MIKSRLWFVIRSILGAGEKKWQNSNKRQDGKNAQPE